MKNILYILVFFAGLTLMNGQSRRLDYLIKIEKGEQWFCANKQTDFRIHEINSKMSYKSKQKVLDEFKKRFKAGDKNVNIKSDFLYLTPEDYLVVYEYTYLYSKNPDKRCTDNESISIKVLKVSNPEDIPEKLNKKLEGSTVKDRLISYRILAVLQPFKKKDQNIFDKLTKEIRDRLKSDKNNWLKKKRENNTVSRRG